MILFSNLLHFEFFGFGIYFIIPTTLKTEFEFRKFRNFFCWETFIPIMSKEEYLALVDRAFEKIPDGFHETDRWKIPIARLEYEGKNTILVNFKDIVDSINRDEKHLFSYILQEVGTAGNIKGNKAILKGKQKLRTVNRLVNNYCETYVICETCGKPDTTIQKEGRAHLLVCQACGTRHPVKL